MAHHFYCWYCGNHINYTESFCEVIPELSGKEFCKIQRMGGFGSGTCSDCYDMFGDDETSYKEYKK